MKKLYIKLAKTLMLWAANRLYAYVDKEGDGIDKADIKIFITEVREVLNKAMRKL